MRAWVRAVAASVAAICLVSPALGQGIIPSVIASTISNMQAAEARSQLCLSGHAPKARKVAAVQSRADTAMRDYLRLAAAGAPADAGPAFTSKTKLRAWSSAGQAGEVVSVDDPVARALAAAGTGLPAPSAFFLSGDLRSALGIWVVRGAGADSAALGHYRVSFRPEGPFLPEGGQIWRITSLELVPGAADPAPATQYCSKPGDVEEYAVAMARFKEERERRKAEKAARRAAAQGS